MTFYDLVNVKPAYRSKRQVSSAIRRGRGICPQFDIYVQPLYRRSQPISSYLY